MELVMGVGPMNLVITNDALYQLSYTSDFATYVLYLKGRHNASLFLIIYCFVVIWPCLRCLPFNCTAAGTLYPRSLLF